MKQKKIKKMDSEHEGAVQSLGARLLQGWAMLALSCKDCHVPLMEDKRNKVIECVSCGALFGREADAFGIEEVVRLEGQKKGEVEIKKDSEGEKKVSEQEEGGEEPVKNEEEEVERIREEMEEERVRGKSRIERRTDKLGDKLLEGWTMLGESCPICFSPLMRDRNKKMWCVVCDVPVVTEEEFDPQTQVQVSEKNISAYKNQIQNSEGTSLDTLGEEREKEEKEEISSAKNVSQDLASFPEEEFPSLKTVVFPFQKLSEEDPQRVVEGTFPDKKIPKYVKKASKKKKGKSFKGKGDAPSQVSDSDSAPSFTVDPATEDEDAPAGPNDAPMTGRQSLRDSSTRGPASSNIVANLTRLKHDTLNTLALKLAKTSELLESTNDINHSLLLCKFISECSKAISSVSKLPGSFNLPNKKDNFQL